MAVTVIAITPYRGPLAPAPRDRHRGPFHECPACGACLAPMTCNQCGKPYPKGHACSPSNGHTRPKHVVMCTPARRLRWGFLWLRRCREPGCHLHQHCDACGWAGILLPLRDEAT